MVVEFLHEECKTPKMQINLKGLQHEALFKIRNKHNSHQSKIGNTHSWPYRIGKTKFYFLFIVNKLFFAEPVQCIEAH
jgi:hypothetical protein